MTEKATEQARAPKSQLTKFLTGYAFWYFANGMNMVLFPWLVAVWLGESASRVGIAQMSTMAPAIVLIMIGGLLADRYDIRKLMIRYDSLSVLPGLALAALFYWDLVGYGVLIGYALIVGSLFAFNMPARDSMLHRVAGGNLQASVTRAAAAQFAAQLVGIVAAGAAASIGVVPLLLLHALANAAAALSSSRLAPAPPETGQPKGAVLRGLADAVVAASRIPEVWPILVAMVGVGICYVGSFLVILPLQVRDLFDGSSVELSIVNLGFWLGTIGATLVLMRAPQVTRPGRIFAIAGMIGVVSLTLIGLGGSFYLLVLLCVLWGAGAGFAMTMGRLLILGYAPPAQRARFMALYQFGLIGGAPLGAFVIGLLAGELGPDRAAFVPAAAMAVLILILLGASKIWRIAAAPTTAPTTAPQTAPQTAPTVAVKDA